MFEKRILRHAKNGELLKINHYLSKEISDKNKKNFTAFISQVAENLNKNGIGIYHVEKYTYDPYLNGSNGPSCTVYLDGKRNIWRIVGNQTAVFDLEKSLQNKIKEVKNETR